MAKYLKCVAPEFVDARVNYPFGSDYDEVWVTAYDVIFPQSTLDTWKALVSGSGRLLTLLNGFLVVDGILVTNDPAIWYGQQANGGAGGSVTAEVPHLLELHFVRLGTCEIYVDTVLVNSGTDTSDSAVNEVAVGNYGEGFPKDPTTDYFGRISVGTTRGGTEIFDDDFEDGTLDAWPTQVGDVSVVDEPTFAPPAPDPVTKISIAFDDGPLVVSPTWTRIDNLDGITVQEWQIARGRPDELSKTGTGTAVIRLVDQTGLFDPTNGASTLFPNVLPDRQVLIELHDPVEDEYQTRFRGFVEQFNYTLGPREALFFVEIECVDAFAWLNDFELEPGTAGDAPPAGSEGNVYYAETAGSVDDRINAILDDTGWPTDPPPTGLSSIFSGNVRVQAVVEAPGKQALSMIYDAADAEFPGVANIYVDREGVVTFHGRQARFRPDVAAYGIRKQDVGDPFATDLDATICPISELSFDLGKATLLNSVSVLPQGIDEADVAGQLVEDATSITDHGKKGQSFTDLLTLEGLATGNNANDETKLMATYYVNNYKDPLPRINRMVFKSRMPDDRLAGPLWKMMCRSDISDLLSVYTTHPDAGGFDGAGYYIEGIRQRCTPANPLIPEVVLELDVSPQALFTSNPFDEDPDPE